MKTTIILFTILLLVIPGVSAVDIKIDVLEVADGRIVAPENMSVSGIMELNSEFVNIGSTAYKARAKLDVLKDSDIIFTGWSDEKEIFPGERADFQIYWFIPDTHEELEGQLSIYHANMIKKYEPIPLSITTAAPTDDPFHIYDFRTYDEYVRFDFNSVKNAEDVTFFVSNVPVGWVFEQKKVDLVRENRDIEVILPYKPSIFSPKEITLVAVSDDGAFYTEKQFVMKKEEGLSYHFNAFVDSLKNFFRSIRDAF